MTNRCLGCMSPIIQGADVCPECGYVQATSAKEAYHLAPGTVLHGRYLVGKAIGYGGFGVTYIGYDLVLESKVAIKEYFPSEFATRMPGSQTLSVYSGEAALQYETGLESFNNEAKRLARLSEIPGVVKIYDTFSDNRTGYIIMEFLEGETVKERLDREKTIPADDALNIIVSVLTTLTAVHPTGMIHRDISPGNIFITNSGEIKLIDFGAARFASATHTKSLSIILKPGYAPEEQYRSRGNQGPWTDIYAVAATMYRMLTGVTPQESIERVGKDELKELSKMGVKVPQNQENAIMNALNITAETRTQSAEQFLGELVGDITVMRNKVVQKKKDEGKWPIWLKIVAACIPVLLVGIFVFIFLNHGAISQNGDFTTVPNIMNKTEADAQTALADSDLKMLVAGTLPVDFGDSGLVQDFTPASGTYIRRFESVSVWLSMNETVFMPYVYMWDQDDARQRIEDAGLNVRVEEVETNEYSSGIIFEQEFDEGVSLSKNTLVTIKTAVNVIVPDETKIVDVPDISGLMLEDALAKLKAVGLFGRVTSEQFGNSEQGTVLSYGKAGAQVPEGTTVEISISKGKAFIYMPDIMLKNKNEAERILSEFGINVNYKYIETNDYVENLVLEQSIAAGTKMYEGDSVTVTLSKFAYGNVPDVSGMSEKEAIAAIEAAGFEVSISSDKIYSDTVPKGNIVKQSVVGQYQKGRTVLLNVSNGKATQTASVPNITGLSEIEAQIVLSDAKFNYQNGGTEYSDTVPEGCVISYSPSGTQTLGISVTYTVSLGSQYISVPDVTGMSLSDAKTAITSAGLSFYDNGTQYSETVSAGLSVSYNPTGKLLRGETVYVTFSKGSEYVSMPDLSERTEMQAISSLLNLGLSSPSVEYIHSETVARGSVVRQSPSAGQSVKLGSSSTIYISKGTAGKYISASELSEYFESDYEITAIPEVRYKITTTEETTVENSSATHSLSGWTLKETVKEDHWSSWIKGTKTAVEGLVETKKSYEKTGTKYYMFCWRATSVHTITGRTEVEFWNYDPNIDYASNPRCPQSGYYTYTSLDSATAYSPGSKATYNGRDWINQGNATAYRGLHDTYWLFIHHTEDIKANVKYYRENSPTYTHYFTKTTTAPWSDWVEERSFSEPSLSFNQTIEYQERTEKYYVVGK